MSAEVPAALRAVRILRLALAINWRSKLKFALLTTLIAVGVLVFLGVSELSRASTSDLTSAIEKDLGRAGTYRVTIASDLGVPRREIAARARAAGATVTATPVEVVQTLPPLQPACPPDRQSDMVTAAVLYDDSGEPRPFDSAASGLRNDDICLAGLVVPATAVRTATPSEETRYGARLIMDAAYARAAMLDSTSPAAYAVLLTTGNSADQTIDVQQAFDAQFGTVAVLAGASADNVAVVDRVDSGTQVRQAASGVSLVYNLIGWGVLLISGLGILVAELIVLRDRTWYFGLTRAVGARKADVAWMVFADIVLILLAGFLTAILAAVLTGPAVTSLGQAAFGIQMDILRPSVLPGLLAGSLLMLAMGGAYPAWRATRLDPLDVLERR